MQSEADVKPGTTKMYQAKEFAELAGVTVRALHHHDRLGLLKPSFRSEAGYRLYSERDFVRLGQIVILKFLGLPLKSIGALLKRDSGTLPDTLRRQQIVLVDKRNQLDKTIDAIDTARKALGTNGETDWTLITQIIRRIAMQNDADWARKYYSEEAQAKVEERKALWSPDLQARLSRDWNDLFRDVEAALGEDPASPKAQALAIRWRKLLSEFTGGDPEIQRGLNAMYEDQSNWPEPQRRQYQIKPEIEEFITRAMKAVPRG
jgi:DNA-binding transcriptional MerR regulator